MERLVVSVRCAAPVAAVLGEGPLYDPRSGKLLFVDIKGEKLFAYDPRRETTDAYAAPGKISALGLRAEGNYVCAYKNGFAYLDLLDDSVRLTPIASPERARPQIRFNDGKVDPFGGFWAGSMDEKETDANAGNWWRLAADGAVARIDSGFHVTNGPAFDTRRGLVYFTDSARRRVYVARSIAEGFAEKRLFRQFGDSDGYPDGMDIDKGGNIWIAFWDGAAVRVFSPDGELLEQIDMPAPRPTSISLLENRAFVTSARTGLSRDALDAAPLSGGLFELGLSRAVSVAPAYFGN